MDAIQVYRQLLARGVILPQLSLFHSRLLLAIRQRIERNAARLVNIVVYRERRKSLFVHK